MNDQERELAAQAVQQGSSMAAGILSLIPGAGAAAPFVSSLGVVIAGVVRALGDDTPEILQNLVAARLEGRITDEDLELDDEAFLRAVDAMYGEAPVLSPVGHSEPPLPDPSSWTLTPPLSPFSPPDEQ